MSEQISDVIKAFLSGQYADVKKCQDEQATEIKAFHEGCTKKDNELELAIQGTSKDFESLMRAIQVRREAMDKLFIRHDKEIAAVVKLAKNAMKVQVIIAVCIGIWVFLRVTGHTP